MSYVCVINENNQNCFLTIESLCHNNNLSCLQSPLFLIKHDYIINWLEIKHNSDMMNISN